MMDICQRARERYSEQINRLWESKRRWKERRRITDLLGNERSETAPFLPWPKREREHGEPAK